MDFKRYLAPTLLVVLLLFLQYCLWFQAGGVIDMLRLKKRFATEQAVNEELKKRNDKILFEVKHLKKNKEAIEARARQELGMIKNGETFYQVVEN